MESLLLDHKITHGNGCSDIDLPRFLCTPARVQLFRRFLSQYKLWLRRASPTEQISKKVDLRLRFARKIEALLDGRLQNPSVQRNIRR